VILFFIAFSLGVACTPASTNASQIVTAEQVQALMGQPDTIILDVRTAGEYNNGHIPGALNIPVQELAKRHSELDKEKLIVLYCRSGNRSASANRILKNAGFAKINNFKGSWRVWTAKKFPVER
jgi:rhodanese-related sulfurtransferase